VDGSLCRRNSQQALRDRPDILESLQAALENLKGRRLAEEPKPTTKRENTLAKLRRDVAHERRLRRISERSYLAAKIRILEAERRVSNLESILRATEHEATVDIARLEGLLASERAKNSDLITTLRKLTPLRKAHDGKV
jgi:hypothetical protein